MKKISCLESICLANSEDAKVRNYCKDCIHWKRGEGTKRKKNGEIVPDGWGKCDIALNDGKFMDHSKYYGTWMARHTNDRYQWRAACKVRFARRENEELRTETEH